MPKACSLDLRERVIEAVEGGASRREAAERFEVSASSAVKWLQSWRREGRRAPRPRGGSRSPLEDYADGVLALVGERPDWTLVAGLRCDEMTAPLLIEGAMNGEIFLSYVEQCLAPALNHGDIVVMDNLRAHKVAGVEEAIEAVGAELLYLPKYSPDLNPIEMSFSKLKAYLRKAAERTQRSLRRRIGLFVPRLGADECANYFAHAGYVSI